MRHCSLRITWDHHCSLPTFQPSKHLFSTSKPQCEDANSTAPTLTFPASSVSQYADANSSHSPQRTHLTTSYPKLLQRPQLATTTHASNRCTPSNQCELDKLISSNKLITSYIRNRDLNSAMKVFDSMTVKTTVTWNSILSGYSKQRGKVKETRELFDRICERDVVSYNTMLACYVHNSDMEGAQRFFGQMPVKDVASWNTMISGFSRNGMMDEARELFSKMPERNHVSWNAIISGYIESGDLNSAVELFQIAPVKGVVSWTAMVSGYMKFGQVKMAEQLFEEMPVKNLVTWNAMVAGYVENCQGEKGLKLFRTMLEYGVAPNPSTLSSVLLGCSNLSTLKLGKQIHQLIHKSPLSKDTTVGTSLISMYCKCGNLEDAFKLFDIMPNKDLVTWNAMISGYAQHGAGEKALHLFDKMKKKGIRPDSITFVGVLSACNHSGLVDLGTSFFNTMSTDYGVTPRPDHYACMVDLLGRAGKLVEATDLIEKMPFKPHSAIFGTLLGACRIHKNLELAEFAAKNLLACDPTSTAGYVQLANVYAGMKKWDHVSRIRKQMRVNKVIKVPGYSWIEVKGVNHKFRSSDRFHLELEPVHEKLRDLEKKMKLAGYKPNLECALHDVEDEMKEKLLLWHSEKLAIAFGLINLPLGIPIRVFKNLRMCEDCHQATRFISAIEGREIIVRDTTRFHHFNYGICSCGEYW